MPRIQCEFCKGRKPFQIEADKQGVVKMRKHLQLKHGTYGAVLSLDCLPGPAQESLRYKRTEEQALRDYLAYDEVVFHLMDLGELVATYYVF